MSVLTRYSPANRSERTCYYLVGTRTARLARTVRATLSALRCPCAPTLAVGVVPPHSGGGGAQRHLLCCCVDLPVPFVPLCLFCTMRCAPNLAVGVVPPHTGGRYTTASSVLLWGFCCTEWVNGPSDLSLLRERSCFDPRESGVNWPSAQAGLHCSVSLPWSRHCLGFPRKGEICRPSAHTKPAVLNLLRLRFPDSTARGEICRPSV